MSIVTYRRAMAMIRDVISFIILFFGIIGPMIPPLGGGDDAEDDVVDVGMVIIFDPLFCGGKGGGNEDAPWQIVYQMSENYSRGASFLSIEI
jgi:hypothetical protein